jgi:ubiquinone/menaquinone biosynthesis C-methylase UbiE
MLTHLLHRVVARPWVYDLAQIAAGARTVRRKVAEKISALHGVPLALDIGGGTGAVGEMWETSTKYICLDIDPEKFEGFRERNPPGVPLLGDATQLPIADRSIDVVLCNSVTHHLSDEPFERMVGEAARVLKEKGKMILTDAVWEPRRFVGRMFWKYDRGSYPRTAAALRRAVSSRFNVLSWEHFTVWHEYFICVAEPRTGRSD